MGAYILIFVALAWCVIAFSTGDMLLDATLTTADSLFDAGCEFCSMVIVCIGLAILFPYIVVNSILELFRR